MNSADMVRAWKDPDRAKADATVKHPAGEITLDFVGGVPNTEALLSAGCCDTHQGCTHPWGCPETLYGSCGAWTFGCCLPVLQQ
jgi:hypothetical protein